MSLNTELQKLSTLKDLTEVKGRDYKSQSADFKDQQTKCLDLLEAAGFESVRANGVLYTACDDRVKGQVEDRRKYIRYCLEQDEGVQDWLEEQLWHLASFSMDRTTYEVEVRDTFYDLLVGGLELVAVKEKQDRCNAQARAHIDDEAPLPPGLTFRPDPYIQQRRS